MYMRTKYVHERIIRQMKKVVKQFRTIAVHKRTSAGKKNPALVAGVCGYVN
jgi:hypothetical protein